MKDFYLNRIVGLLKKYEPGRPEMKPDVMKQLKEMELLQKQLDLISSAKDSLIDYDKEGNEVRFFSSQFLVEEYLTAMSPEKLKRNRKLKMIEDKIMQGENIEDSEFDNSEEN